jgi:hypothetical protein
MSGSQAGAKAAAVAFGVALLFATGGFGFLLLFQAVRLNSDLPPPRQPVPAAAELELLGPEPTEVAVPEAPEPHPAPRKTSPSAPAPAAWEGD